MKKKLLILFLISIIFTGVSFAQEKSTDPFTEIIEKQTKKEAKKELTEEELYDLQRQFDSLIKRKQFKSALGTVQLIPERKLSKSQKIIKKHLVFFETIENEAEEKGGLFASEKDLDSYTKNTVKRLYREAQKAYIDGEDDIVRDLLIHIIYLHRRNVKAKKFMEFAYDAKVGSYKVEDMEEKYWKISDVSFYGGNYRESVRALKILTYFDRENPVLYEKLGSSYYMMAQRKKAVDAWKTAIFLGGKKNKELDSIIKKTEKQIKEDRLKAKKRKESRKGRIKESVVTGKTKLMGVFPTEEKAYSFASELKKQNKKAIVEETKEGKFAVKVVIEENKKK